MKRSLRKKHGDLLVLSIVSLLSILIPSGIVIAVKCPPGTVCVNSQVNASSSATAQTGFCANGCPKPSTESDRFPSVSGEINTYDVFYDSKGNLIAVVLHDEFDNRDKNTLIDSGIPDNLIFRSNEINIQLPKGSIENETSANEWKKFYDELSEDFAKMDDNGNYSINPDSDAYKLGVFLGLYSGDVEKDNDALLEGKITGFSVEKGATIIINGNKMSITASNARTVCAPYIENYSNTPFGTIGSYCRALEESHGKFGDDGEYECSINTTCVQKTMAEEGVDDETARALCCLEKYGQNQKKGICCYYFYSPEECDKSEKPDIPPEDECPSPKIVKPTVVDAPPRNTPYTTGGSCGGNFTSVTYDYSQTMCEGLVVIEKQTTVSIELSKLNNSIYYAGTTFNWNDISSHQNVMTSVFDTSALQNKMSEIKAKIQNFENRIGSLECQINKIDDRNADAYCQNLSDQAYTDCVNAVNRAKEQEIESLRKEIEKIKNDEEYKNANADLEKYNNCSIEASNYVPTYDTTSHVASVDSEYISFNNTDIVYQKGEVVAINKNNGNALTLKDMKNEILENETYLKIMSDFYIPTSIKNGTSGVAHRDLTGTNVSISYDCPFNVVNSIRCSDDECDSKGLNIIYRPISLTNPFPIEDTQYQYRAFGANWSIQLAETYILNNRNVKDYEVYNLTPLYTITLTPSTIKDIRKYNKTHSMNDFIMNCSEGYKCTSNFLWSEFNNIIDESNSCASSIGWDITCYNGGVSE